VFLEGKNTFFITKVKKTLKIQAQMHFMDHTVPIEVRFGLK